RISQCSAMPAPARPTSPSPAAEETKENASLDSSCLGSLSVRTPSGAKCSIILAGRRHRVPRITLGLATSHGPMLSVRPETWPERVKADRANPQHFFKGKTYTFDELVAVRKAEQLGEQVSLEIFRERHARCRQAIHTLADIFEANKADVAV